MMKNSVNLREHETVSKKREKRSVSELGQVNSLPHIPFHDVMTATGIGKTSWAAISTTFHPECNSLDFLV